MEERILAFELKRADNEIGRAMFEMNKKKNIAKAPSPLQRRIIRYLAKHEKEDVYQKDLEEAFGVTKATMSQTLTTLEMNKEIVRKDDKEDGRKKKIILTKKSKDNIKEIEKNFKALNKKITKDISERELKQFYKTLDKIIENVRPKSKK